MVTVLVVRVLLFSVAVFWVPTSSCSSRTCFSFPCLRSLADSDFDSFYKATYKKGAAKGKGKTAEIRGSSKSKVGRITGYNVKSGTVLIAPSSRLWFRTSGER